MILKRTPQPMNFVVTEAHIKLLARANIGWCDYAYDGAPGFDPKRPFGNSDVPRDILEITQPERAAAMTEEDWDDWYDGDHSDLMTLFYELGFVTQIAIALVGQGVLMEPGPYHMTKRYSHNSWKKGVRRQDSR